MNAMFSIFLVLALSLQHELLQYVVITCNDANETMLTSRNEEFPEKVRYLIFSSEQCP